VWSGASSVGQFAVQLAKLAGLTVVATASPKNHELLKSLGATHVFDYRDPDVVKKIKEVFFKFLEGGIKFKEKEEVCRISSFELIRIAQVTHNELAHGIDCVSEAESQTKSAESFGAKGGNLAVIMPPVEKKPREDVQHIHELLYTSLGRVSKREVGEKGERDRLCFENSFIQSKIGTMNSLVISRNLTRRGEEILIVNRRLHPGVKSSQHPRRTVSSFAISSKLNTIPC